MLERPKISKKEAEWIEEFKAIMKRLPNGILFTLNSGDFKTGANGELSLMKKTCYGAAGVEKPFKVRCA